jgi:glycosyltransferase involved in cell wall biosynthesis
MPKLRSLAGANVRLLGRQPFEVLREHLQTARAFLFAAEEDFGIAPLEAQACGTPVLAFGRGAARETIRDGESGMLFEEQTPPSLLAAIERFERLGHDMTPARCRANAQRFSTERFREEWSGFVARRWAAWQEDVRDGRA